MWLAVPLELSHLGACNHGYPSHVAVMRLRVRIERSRRSRQGVIRRDLEDYLHEVLRQSRIRKRSRVSPRSPRPLTWMLSVQSNTQMVVTTMLWIFDICEVERISMAACRGA